MASPTYSVAVCNYNMAGTLRESITSIHEHTDERFEILVIDDGSTDQSLAVLEALSGEFERVRHVALEADSSRHLGATRNVSVREANGEHVLLQLDADDRYSKGICDFVEVYQQFRSQLETEFYLKGRSINVASREFLLEYGPYRNLPVGAEDTDLWRRLFADDAIIWLDHDSFATEIKDYKPSRKDWIRRDLKIKTGELQSGLDVFSYLQWGWHRDTGIRRIYQTFSILVAELVAKTRQSHQIHSPFDQKGALEERIDATRGMLESVETTYGVTVDRERLTPRGRQIFYGA